jgi:rubrerythrin
MNPSLTAKEIFDIAIQIERDGKLFYQRAAELFDGEVKETLLGLAEMEENHETFFVKLKELLSEPDSEQMRFDAKRESGSFLTALARTKIFDLDRSAEQTWPANSSIDDIFRMAIHSEKESIVYYVGLKEVVPDEITKLKIKEILKEEMKHITLLTETLMNLRKEG